MFPPGHYGMAMALYAVVGYVLLKRGYVRDALSGGGIVLAYTLFPDMDGKLSFVVHRGVTHTLWFAVVVGAFCVVVVSTSLARRERREAVRGAGWAFFLGAFAVVAHLLADVVNPWGIMPLYPVSSALFTLDLVRATNDAANYGMFAAGASIAAATLAVALPREEKSSPPRLHLLRRAYRWLRARAAAPK